MSTHHPAGPGSTAAPPGSGPRWGRVLRWAAAAMVLATGFYLSAFFAGWTFHPAADPGLVDAASGLGFAALLGVVTVAVSRLLVGRRTLSSWLLLGLLFPLISAADAYLW